jgi:hypothetical protein
MKYPKEFEKHWQITLKTASQWEMKEFYFKAWKTAMDKAISKVKKMKKNCGGIYQHKDIDFLINDLEEIIK